MNNEFYRICTLFTLLNKSQKQHKKHHGKTINKLSEILQIDKDVICSDMASILKNTKSEYTLISDDYATEEEEKLLDELLNTVNGESESADSDKEKNESVDTNKEESESADSDKEKNESVDTNKEENGSKNIEDKKNVNIDIDRNLILRRLKTGEYDDLPFLISGPADRNGLVTKAITLTNSELNELSDFLKHLDRTVIGDRSDTHVLFKGTTIYHTEKEMEVIEQLSEMIREQKTAVITYQSEDNVLTIRPVQLFHTNVEDVYYLIAFQEMDETSDDGESCLKEMTFRVERIIDIDEAIIPLPDPDMSSLPPFEKMWGIERGKEFHVKLQIYDEANVIEKVRRDLGERKSKLTEGEDGCYYYEDDLIGENIFRNWVRGYGSSIIVLEPESIRQKMIETYKALLENHSS